MAVQLTFSAKIQGFDDIGKKLETACGQAKHVVAVQIEKDTSPFVPMRTGSLDQRTRVVDNVIIYPGPYAHYLYEGIVYVDPKTGAAGFLTKEGWRSRKGVTKVPSSKTLDISTAKHEQAQSHWMEASASQNMEKWQRVAGEAILHKFK